MVFFFLRFIAWLVPNVPAVLVTKIKCDRYLAKQTLADYLPPCAASVKGPADPGPTPLATPPPSPGFSSTFIHPPPPTPPPFLVCPGPEEGLAQIPLIIS